MARDQISTESQKVISLTDHASFRGLIVGSTTAIDALSCELQSMKPEQLRAVLNVMQGSGHFKSIEPFYGKDGSTITALAFTEKDGSGVFGQIKDPISEVATDSCHHKK